MQDDGKPYLVSIKYGGHGDNLQYLIEMSYQKNNRGIHTFGNGSRLLQNQRVEKVTVKSMEKGIFEAIYTYFFTYKMSEISPAFWLTGVQKTYPNGDKDPLQSFDYNFADDFLEQAKWNKNNFLSNLSENLPSQFDF